MSADEIDWPSVRRLFPDDEYLVQARRVHDAQATGVELARGVLDEARRRMHTDPEFHARVRQAAGVALAAGPRPRDPDEARRWLDLGAAVAVVLDLRDPIHDNPDPRRPIV